MCPSSNSESLAIKSIWLDGEENSKLTRVFRMRRSGKWQSDKNFDNYLTQVKKLGI